MRGEVFLWLTRGIGLALGVVFVAATLFVSLRASNVLLLVFLAILLASALEPFVGWVRAHLPLGRGATILVVYALFLLGVAFLVFLLVPAAVTQAEELSKSLPPFLQNLRGQVAELRPPALASSLTALVDAAADFFKPAPPPAPDQVVSASLTVVEGVVSLITLLTVVFFWLVEHARLQRYALSFVPAPRRSGWREAWNDVETRLGLWVRGQLTLMVAIGVATSIAYTVLGLPSALLLGVFAGIAEAIPIVGPAVGAIPALIIAVTVSPELAILVAIVYVVLQFLEGNVLVPLVMKNTIGLSPFIVIVSLLIGAAAGGIVGAFVAVPLAAAVEVILERLQAREIPVSQEPSSSNADPDQATRDDQARALPDSSASSTAR
jgi:predicted PurR-regulated permease PerM